MPIQEFSESKVMIILVEDGLSLVVTEALYSVPPMPAGLASSSAIWACWAGKRASKQMNKQVKQQASKQASKRASNHAIK
jgi:hypothetical protein